jgi:hypothetical protein
MEDIFKNMKFHEMNSENETPIDRDFDDVEKTSTSILAENAEINRKQESIYLMS